MNILPYIWVVLCLVVDTNTRSVTTADDEPSHGAVSSQERKADGLHAAKICKCENGVCKENYRGDLVCTCPSEWGLYSSTHCKKCNCGKDSNCTFDPGWMSDVKKCLCKAGYEDKNGVCRGTCKTNPCQNGGHCLVKGNDIECRCKEAFFGELCQNKEICSCVNGLCKENNRGDLVCTCPSEWGLYSPTHCKKCNCGQDSNCTFNPGFLSDGKKCLCKAGYEDIKGVCKEIFTPTSTTVDASNTTWNSTGFSTHPTSVITGAEIFTPTSTTVDASNTTWNSTWFSTYSTAVTRGTEIFTPTSTTVDASNTTWNSTGFSTHPTSVITGAEIFTPIRTSVDASNTTWNSTWFSTHPTAVTTGTDLCTQYPCKNGGTCLVDGNKSKCLCRKPYVGILCETDPCAWNPCKNGGLCKIENESVKCFCKQPFTGEFCESNTKIDAYVLLLLLSRYF